MTGGRWTSQALQPVAAFLREEAGLVFPAGQADRLEDGARRVAAHLGAATPRALLQLLRERPEVLDQLLHELTIGESFFFREPEQLEFIRTDVVPPLLRSRGAISVWSAGCAAGEEAYTLAILLRELVGGEKLHIVGTDVSEPRLATARAGVYGRWSLRGVPDAVVDRHFARRGRRFAIVPQLRDGVEFQRLNLAADRYVEALGGERFDLILCRNVLIYLDSAAVSRIAGRLIDTLSDDGWLFLGASDPMLSELVPCERVATGAGVAYRRPRAKGEARLAPRLTAGPLASASPPKQRRRAPLAALPPARQSASSSAADPELRVPPLPVADQDASEAARRVRALADAGDLPAAGRACAAALDRHRESSQLHYLHALLLTEGGRHAQAEEAVRRALYLDRSLVVGHLLLGLILTRRGRGEEARRPLAVAVRMLASLEPDAEVAGSGGVSVAHLLGIARAQLRAQERGS